MTDLKNVSPTVQIRLDERERCRQDKQFLSEVMGYDFVPEVHQELWAQYPQYDDKKPWAFQSDIKKRLILWSRGHFKTSSVVVEIVQIILNFPDIRILIMQGSKTVTQNLLHEIKSHFTGQNPNSRINNLFPEFCADELGNANEFTVPARRQQGLAQATVTVASPRSVKTGQHYDIGFFDDLVNDQNYRSPRLLKRVREDFNMCLPLIDPPHYAVVTGTRYAHGDLYEEIIRWNKGEWTVSLKTCWLDDLGTQVRFPQQPAKNKPEKIIGFTREGLLLMQQNDPAMFSGQYLNKPIQHGGQTFTKLMLDNALILPADAPGLSPAHLFIDIAGTDNEYSDDSVILAGKHDTLMTQYVVDVRGDRWLTEQLAQNVIEMALIHRPVKIWFEKTASAVYFVEYLKLIAKYQNIYLPIDFIKVSNKPDAKYIRIGSLTGLLKHKKLKFFVGLHRWDRIIEQFERFPGGKNKHDDYPDTIALMTQTFGGETLATPVRRTHINPILAMIAQREQDTAHVMETPYAPDGVEGFDAF
jgi:predicted phage terminase large subunit-like protein